MEFQTTTFRIKFHELKLKDEEIFDIRPAIWFDTKGPEILHTDIKIENKILKILDKSMP